MSDRMRRIFVFNQFSADGYFAAPDGNLNWVVPDDEMEQSAVSGMTQADTILFGRRTYEMFEKFWPHALDEHSNTSADPHAEGRRTSGLRAIAVWINDAKKVVFSKTLKDVTWKNSRLVREIDPREIEAMKREPGKDMIIFGSGTLVSQLTERGLIDEYQFLVCPILLGRGVSMLTNMPKSAKLTLLNAKANRSGNVMLHYARG